MNSLDAGDVPVPGLADILRDRELRQERRIKLTDAWKYRHIAILQLSISAPGSRKNSEDIQKPIELGVRAWEQRAEALGIRLLYSESGSGAAGPLFLWVVEADPFSTKSLVVGLEDGCGLGRLWDFDVYDDRGKRIGREYVGSPYRRCYICEGDAAVCAGRRLHEIDLVERKFKELLEHGLAAQKARMDEL